MPLAGLPVAHLETELRTNDRVRVFQHMRSATCWEPTTSNALGHAAHHLACTVDERGAEVWVCS